jgi:hypothetical protein
MVPVAAPPPGTLLTLQVTAVFVVPLTLAVNCCVRPSRTLAVPGETVTEMEGGGGGGGATGPVPPPPQPSVHAPAVRRVIRSEARETSLGKSRTRGPFAEMWPRNSQRNGGA